jgi:hypothetical protein
MAKAPYIADRLGILREYWRGEPQAVRDVTHGLEWFEAWFEAKDEARARARGY